MIWLLALMASPAPACAQVDGIEDVPAIAATIAALEAEDIAGARRLIADTGHAYVGERIVFLPAEAIALLAGCEARELGRSRFQGYPLFVFEWDCGRKDYTGALVPSDDRQSVLAYNIVEGDGAKRLLQGIPIPPPPVRIVAQTPEVQARLDREAEEHRQRLNMISLTKGDKFARLMTEGDTEALLAAVNQYSEIRLAFQHPSMTQEFVEMTGTDAAALAEQLAFIKDTLGRPTGYSCEIEDRRTRCDWQFDELGKRLSAYINGCCTDRWLIGRIDFRYSTRAKAEEFGIVDNDERPQQ